MYKLTRSIIDPAEVIQLIYCTMINENKSVKQYYQN